MSITTYSELQAQIAAFLDRSDLPVTTFIALAESAINRRLRHWKQESRATLSASSQYTALPSDWVETIRLTSGEYEIEQVSYAHMGDLRAANDDTAGQPLYFSHIGGEIELFPTPSEATSLSLVYVSSIPALTDAAPTNWLLSAAPDILLYGALKHSAPYLVEDVRVPIWEGLYQQALGELISEGRKAKHSGSGLKVRVGNVR